MGTLFHQRERDWLNVTDDGVERFLEYAITLSKKYKVKVSDVLEVYKVLEMQRANDLYVKNGDAFDEQMAGIGKLLQKIGRTSESFDTYLEDDEL